MIQTLTHPTHDDLVRCATTIDLSDPLLMRVRRHLEVDRCETCGTTVHGLLSRSVRAIHRSPLLRRWIRPLHARSRTGTRVGAAADYQLVCSVGPFALDVLVRDCETERELRFVGQVTHAGRIHEPVAELALHLIGIPAAPADDTATDQFGEFALSSARDGIYGLRLGAGLDAPCVMVWEGWEA